MSVKKTMNQRLLELFEDDRQPKTIKTLARAMRLTPSRVRYLISELRLDGYPIFRAYDAGRRSYVFYLGLPTRQMVSIAAATVGSSLFTR